MTVGLGWTKFYVEEAAWTMFSIFWEASLPRWQVVGLRVLVVA
jgi:hypothetical protein